MSDTGECLLKVEIGHFSDIPQWKNTIIDFTCFANETYGPNSGNVMWRSQVVVLLNMQMVYI